MNRLRLAAFALAGLLAAPAWATLQAPTILLSPASIVGAGTSTLTITLDNDPPGNPSNIAFNFVYPANVFNSAAPNPTTNCLGGTVSAPAGGNSLSLSGASISGNNVCTVTVTLRSCNLGNYSIGGFGVTSSSGNPTAGTANLQVTSHSAAVAGTSTVSASPGSVPADGATFATVTVTAINVCGTAAPDKTITLGQGGGSSVISPVSVVTNASGVAMFSVTNTTSQTVTYTATDVTDSVVITQTAAVTFIAIASSFNVVETGGPPATGRIFTKVAGENILVDIVALDPSNNVATTFTGDVTVELVDNSGGGACADLLLVKTLAAQTFIAGDNGRHALSAGQFEANAYRNLRFRIKYPTASPTVTACSSDAFANRPKFFVSVAASDQDRTTAGILRALNNTSNPGTGNVHNAGRPFRLDATAQNGAGAPATTTLYAPDAGQPVAVLSQCGVAAVCPAALGTLGTGAWSASNGVITSVTASYSDVGAFDLLLEDQTFASVDAADGTATSVRYIRSAALLTVGRFVPDHFTVEAGSSITPRSDIGACAGSSFTYLGERMDLVFNLVAREAGGAVTTGYSGATLGALALASAASYGFGAIDTAAPTLLSARLDTSLIAGIVASWSAGTVSITAPVGVARAAAPDGPYAALRLGIAPTDPDGVTLSAAGMNLDADNSGTPERAQVGPITAVRFGRLRMQSAYGPGTVALPMLLDLQYWSGTAFVHNAGDSCTTLAAPDIALSDYKLNLGAGETSIVEATINFTTGGGRLTLSAPGAANNGSVLLTPNLAATRSYLRGKWTGATWDEDPAARATFGLYGSQPKNFIFFRENY
jgi:MSHA biogenesis protein MshQ